MFLAGTPVTPLSSLLGLSAQNPWVLSSVRHYSEPSETQPSRVSLTVFTTPNSAAWTLLTTHRTAPHPCLATVVLSPCSREVVPPLPHIKQPLSKAEGPGLCRMPPETGPHLQHPVLVSCTHSTPGVRSGHVPQAQCSMAEAGQGHLLPVCVFGNGTRIELKEDDAHELQGWLCSHGHKVCGKRRTMSCEEQCQRAFPMPQWPRAHHQQAGLA